MSYNMIYMTVGTKEEAINISNTLVQEKLVACANIIPGMISVYRWKGTIETAEEYSVLLKTRSGLVQNVIEKIKLLHSYECPCILAIPIENGNKKFLEWISQETQI
ncbi:MAG: divalent-cation tolerance protein CutA [Fibrobacteria bacterium]|nr:divalent-cation tolerance protein CutA [Fibrobacteria bacterium]